MRSQIRTSHFFIPLLFYKAGIVSILTQLTNEPVQFKSASMKSSQPSFYFSAYPLKAINDPSASSASQQTPYLRAVLSGKTKASSKIRVFPMVNPYTKTKVQHKPVKPARQVDASGDEWFNHYE